MTHKGHYYSVWVAHGRKGGSGRGVPFIPGKNHWAIPQIAGGLQTHGGESVQARPGRWGWRVSWEAGEMFVGKLGRGSPPETKAEVREPKGI